MKLADDSRKTHEARSKKLMAMTQRQMRDSSKNMAARASLGDEPVSGRSLQLSDAHVDSGMVLPFEPMTMTFSDVHYYVPLPQVSPLTYNPWSPMLLPLEPMNPGGHKNFHAASKPPPHPPPSFAGS